MTTHASVRQGSTKNRRRMNRVSIGTLPYQMTRYCDQKKYIQRIEIANWSFATSWIATGGIDASPRPLARTARIDRRQKPVWSDVPTKNPPKSPLYQCGSIDTTRSKPQSETATTQSI